MKRMVTEKIMKNRYKKISPVTVWLIPTPKESVHSSWANQKWMKAFKWIRSDYVVQNDRKHKYAELIHAWANGATIQVYWTGSGMTQYDWIDVEYPIWNMDDCKTLEGENITWRFRIKPE
jgi:hypothetical protein